MKLVKNEVLRSIYEEAHQTRDYVAREQYRNGSYSRSAGDSAENALRRIEKMAFELLLLPDEK